MRIKELHAQNIPPVELLNVDNLSDLVVIAGPNGIGKTRLVSAFIAYFQNLTDTSVKFTIEATVKSEAEEWGKNILDTSNAKDAQLLKKTLQQNRSRRNFNSRILYYESNRTIQKIQPLAYQWEMPDPWDEQVSWNLTYGGFAVRFQDTLHAIFKKIQNQKTSIANRAITLKQQGHASMNLEFTDPLDPFRDAFFKLLGPKELVRADLQANTLRFRLNNNEYDINVLSAGEREVLNVTFDFLLRCPSDCIIFFDEPELHLHPELSSKLISTLKSIGKNNQFFLCSHSPDIISSSLEDTVVFLTPPRGDGSNQAVVLKPDDESTEALNRLGHSVGVVSLGKKIVLIEGAGASLDKQTYVHLLKNRYPNLVLLPSGGKGNLSAFDQIAETVLNRSIWGIDFYMLADRDAVSDGASLEAKAQGRFRYLSRYHLENYFLDEEVLAEVFRSMEPDDSWLCDPAKISAVLLEIARDHLPYAVALTVAGEKRRTVGNIDIMLKSCQRQSKENMAEEFANRCRFEIDRISTALNVEQVSRSCTAVYEKLERSTEKNNEFWKRDIPGKPIFKTFCSKAKMPEGRLKTLYIQKAEGMTSNPFREIIEIFGQFAGNE